MQNRNGSYRQNHPVRERSRYDGYRFETVSKQSINIISNIALIQILMAEHGQENSKENNKQKSFKINLKNLEVILN